MSLHTLRDDDSLSPCIQRVCHAHAEVENGSTKLMVSGLCEGLFELGLHLDQLTELVFDLFASQSACRFRLRRFRHSDRGRSCRRGHELKLSHRWMLLFGNFRLRRQQCCSLIYYWSLALKEPDGSDGSQDDPENEPYAASHTIEATPSPDCLSTTQRLTVYQVHEFPRSRIIGQHYWSVLATARGTAAVILPG